MQLRLLSICATVPLLAVAQVYSRAKDNVGLTDRLQMPRLPQEESVVDFAKSRPDVGTYTKAADQGATSLRGAGESIAGRAGESESFQDTQKAIAKAAGQEPKLGFSQVKDQNAACSCDCCQVTKLLPSHFVNRPGGQQVTSTCAKAQGAPDGIENPTCPTQCAADKDNKNLAAAPGPMDYMRFCNYNCRPVADMEGAQCIQLSNRLTKRVKASESGNGKDLFTEPVLGFGSGLGFGGATGVAKAGGDGKDKGKSNGNGNGNGNGQGGNKGSGGASGGNEEAKLKVVYDMRKLVAERLRSEAGAAVSAGASSAEAVRLNTYNTKQATKKLKKISAQTIALAGSLEGGVTGVEGAKQTAEEAERKTGNMLKQGHNFAASMMKKVKKLTEAAIKKAIAPCVQTAADNIAEGKNLDKPKNWDRVVAARAANPYMAAVTAAVQRTAEYRRLSEATHAKALAAQLQANALMPHINVMEAQGDKLQAVVDRNKAKNLLKSAQALQAEAQGYWNTAQNTNNQISKWQAAATQAAAYAAWDYKASEGAFK